MEIELDFRRSGLSAPGATAPGPAEELLACYQFALGHELPNRLVVIQAFARLLTEQGRAGLDDEARILLERLAISAQRLDELVRRLAEIGQLCREIESGGEGVSVGEVAREAIAEMNLLSGGQSIEYHLDEALPVLPVSRRALHQVLVQLLRNAAQAAIPGRALRVEVGGNSDAEGARVWVRDNGRGVSATTAPRLFEAFAFGAAGGGPGVSRAGLGLFLVRQVVARWGGVLRLCSEPEQGTTVTLLVPGL